MTLTQFVFEDEEAEPHPAMAMAGRRFAQQEYQAALENRSIPQGEIDTHRKRLDPDFHYSYRNSYRSAYFLEHAKLEAWRLEVEWGMTRIRVLENRYKVFDVWRATKDGENYAAMKVDLQNLGWSNKARSFFESAPFEKTIDGVVVSIYFSSDEQVVVKDAPGLNGASAGSLIVHVPSPAFGPCFQHDACDIQPTEKGHGLIDGESITAYAKRLDSLAREFANHVLSDPRTGPCPARDNVKRTRDNDYSL